MTSATKTATKTIRIPLTQGNIRNGHVYLRDYLWFFPKESIAGENAQRAAEPCELDIPGIGVIETEIDARKAIFRWRGWRRYYEAAGAQQGDHLVFNRIDRNRYVVSVEHGLLGPLVDDASGTVARSKPTRCNDLSGDEWLRYSVSIWSDIRKTAEEAALNHPAMFPTALCERLMLMFLPRRGKHRILDPFMGSGSTIIAARNLGKVGIGLDISDEYITLAQSRLDEPSLFGHSAPEYRLLKADARDLLDHVPESSIDLCITSPPYWDILNQARTADYKDTRHYGNLSADLGIVSDYDEFLNQIQHVFTGVYKTLVSRAYCAVVVMDLRKKDRFFPFHSDLAAKVSEVGFVYDDVIIWDRRHEYNNLRPLGYPSVFRVNKIHEFILLFRKV